MEWSRLKLLPFRELRLRALRQFVGANYSYTGSDDRVPLNLLQLAVNIYCRQLAARAPRALVHAKDPSLKPLAANMQAWMDSASEGMRLDFALRAWVTDALFSIGVLKVGEYSVGEVEVQGTLMQVGQPFAEPVDLDDFVFDILAKRFEECRYYGNRYRVPLSEVKDNKLYSREARDKLAPAYRYYYNEKGDVRPTTLSQGTAQPYDEVEDNVELWDLYLPKERLVVTVPHEPSVQGGLSGPALRVQDWTGPDHGPYHVLSYVDVPDNVMPAAPVTALIDLHELVNRIWNKLGQQSDRQKTVVGVMGTATEDGERVVGCGDGDMVRMDHPDRVREFRYGGPDRDQMMFAETVKQTFSYSAGNLESLGGLSPQASTLGQDELLARNSSAQVAEMQERTISAVQRVYRSLAWHWYKNPTLTYTTRRMAHGQSVPVSIPPDKRQAPFESLDFRIDPYSMSHDSPTQRGQKLVQLFQQLLLPLQQQLGAQGVQVKFPKLLELLAAYLDVPDLPDILVQGPPPELQGAAGIAKGAAHDASQSPVTTRNTVRTNRPSMTAAGNSAVLQQLLAGGGQPKQAENFGRPPG